MFKSIYDKLTSTRASAMYILLFAIAIGAATFIENDFGTNTAQKLIYKATWFELLLLLFSLSLFQNMRRYRLFEQKKWSTLLFHLSVILILIGAGITRYIGYEGMMHIRENQSANTFVSTDSYLEFTMNQDGKTYVFQEPVLFGSLGSSKWSQRYLIDETIVKVEVEDFIPNPITKIAESDNGIGILKIVLSGAKGREEYYLNEGDIKTFGRLTFNFNDSIVEDAINIKPVGDDLEFQYNKDLNRMVMQTQQIDTISGSDNYQELKLRSLYNNGSSNFVFAEYLPKAKKIVVADHLKMNPSSQGAVKLNVSIDGEEKSGLIYGRAGVIGTPGVFDLEKASVSAAWGSKVISLPFRIYLNDFILDKYPGTNNPSSYESKVVLEDPKNNVNEDFRIYMNNILNYGGYRFFQSSYDKDEKGTYLSVNHDYWGTLITYIGYILLTIGMIGTLLQKNTRFKYLRTQVQKMQKASTMVLFIFLSLGHQEADSQNLNTTIDPLDHMVSIEHATQFSLLVVQDFKGRMKPVNTMSNEILRKIYRKSSFQGLNSDQMILSMFAHPNFWYDTPIIKLGKHKDIQSLLNVDSDFASYNQFFTEKGTYKLREAVEMAHNVIQKERGVYEKELIKIDERVNILNMVFGGGFLKIIPSTDDPSNTWASVLNRETKNEVADKFFSAYKPELQKAIATNDYTFINALVTELGAYQKRAASSIIPNDTKLKAEVLLNKFNIFNRLALADFLLGMALLILLFTSVFKPNLKLQTIHKFLLSLIIVSFIVHTAGLGLRWYVSERAPWSNGYESMIYIAWTSVLSGIIFARKSVGALAATMVLAATILLVSMLSFLDPEITPLVPVLKSYWLTIHVSLEAGSYGFLMLGAIIGLINLLLYIFISKNNKTRILKMIKEMSYISELTLIGGLFMMSVGTYLGGIWANESWGRYWGWDAKETWALVTILVYTFILHMRLIPKMKGFYNYNVASLFGLASVIMTYYGVNYYLSGLHSYATGDPVPIPNWVYYTVIALIAISILAYFKKKEHKLT